VFKSYIENKLLASFQKSFRFLKTLPFPIFRRNFSATRKTKTKLLVEGLVFKALLKKYDI